MPLRKARRSTAALVGAMSLISRCRASLSASSGASCVVRPPAASAMATAAARSFSTRQGQRSVGFLYLVSTPTAGRAYHRAESSLPRRRCGGWMSVSFASASSLTQRGSGTGSPVDEVRHNYAVRDMPSQKTRRRGRTALGMVSDRPFRSPRAEVLEEVDFRTLGLLDELVEAMDEFGFKIPSKIQRQAIPQVLNGGNVVIAASTGSGKTLAYLMPLIQHLRSQEMVEVGTEAVVRQTQRPRALVLVPTRELANQVLEVAKRLSRTCKISSCGIVGGEDYGKQKQRLAGTVDVVVATPARFDLSAADGQRELGRLDTVLVCDGRDSSLESLLRFTEIGRLLKHQEQGNFFLSKVTHVVVDEVDTMFTQGFAPDIEKLTRPVLANPERRESAQFVFVTATFTKPVRALLDEGKYPKVRVLETRDVHHTLPTLNHVMIDIKGRDKMSCLVDITQQYRRDFKRTLVFCNTIKSCRAAEFGLREADIPSLSYHGDVPSDERATNLDRFKAGEVEFLVCTDIAARGLDMPDVNHVVMFDFPLNPIDYLHRSGRTARMGAKGRVSSLLAKRDLVLAAAIEQAVQAGMPLDELSSRKTDYANGARLGPLFGRQGKVARRGNHHALKPVMNTRARGPVNWKGEKAGQPRKGDKVQLAEVGGRKGGAARSRGPSSGPGRARKYN